MEPRVFWKTVTLDRSEFLDRLLAILGEHRIRHCVIGGQAVNAYAEPVVSLDLDFVVAVEQLPEAERVLRHAFTVERFPHSLNVSSAGSGEGHPQLRARVPADVLSQLRR